MSASIEKKLDVNEKTGKTVCRAVKKDEHFFLV